MRKLILLMHVSMDGFTAGSKGEMDWIHVDDEMFDAVGRLTDEADTALYGRVTYEMMENYWPTAGEKANATKHDIEHANWVNNSLKIVISRTLEKTNWNHSKIISENIYDEIQNIKQQPGKNILMIGSPGTVHTFMQLGLIDEFWLYLNPVILGNGLPLFITGNMKIDLELLEIKKFGGGVASMHYKIKGRDT